METIYLIIVIVLFLLAASDLVVGVSNDAVNFLNSAIGSKAASFKVIIGVAALGVLIGAVFSSGMMEVARKGIFNPGEFYFSEVMIIFMAVMVTDILLLDAFNTIGLPTSTTVSIVFELLGASVAMGAIKMIHSESGLTLSQFINSSKALAIISGILVSVGIAFTVGAFIQYLARMLFSFNYKRRMKYFGAVWGGLAFAAMTYFIVIKGAKGATFMEGPVEEWINANTMKLILGSFIVWTIVLQFSVSLFKLNILRLIVLVGTFALAMAFAGNDLVNFIGVPIAGFNAWEIYTATPGAQADSFLMTALGGKVPTPTLFLILAGIVMVATLITSKKAISVVKTSLDLSRQSEGEERFKANWFSKLLVRYSLAASSGIQKVVPNKLIAGIERQFEPYEDEEEKADPPEFDLVRASVTLTVASILIALGTSLKLPLSTTYVTFMVAMGTSLSDKAWDRESAVYRISGVVAVIGGWFFTALSAFTVSFILVFVFYYTAYDGIPIGIFAVLIFAVYLLYRTHRHHKKSAVATRDESVEIHSITDKNISEKSTVKVMKNLKNVLADFDKVIKGLEKEDIKGLKKAESSVASMTKRTKYLKNHLSIVVDKIGEDSLDAGYYYVQVLDYMREMLHSIEFIIKPSLEHVANNHKPLVKEQIDDLKNLQSLLKKIINLIIISIESNDFNAQAEILAIQKDYLKLIDQSTKKQIQRVKNGQVGTRNTMLFLNIIRECKNLVLQVVNIFKSQRDFIEFKKGIKKV